MATADTIIPVWRSYTAIGRLARHLRFKKEKCCFFFLFAWRESSVNLEN